MPERRPTYRQPTPRQRREVSQRAAHSAFQSDARQTSARPAPQRAARPASQRAARPASQLTGRPKRGASRAAARPASQRAARPAPQRAARPAPQRAVPTSPAYSAYSASQRAAHSSSLLDRILELPRPILVVGAIVILLVLILSLSHACSGCTSTPASAPAPTTNAENATETPAKTTNESTQPAEETPLTIDEDALITSLGADPQAEYEKLMTLAENEPDAYRYVAQFANYYPADTAEPCTEPVEAGTVPLLLQWDQRWGYTVYCSSAFGMTGCAPTSFAMVYQGLTGKNDLSPYDMGQLAQQDGYMYTYNGTDTAFFAAESDRLGLTCVDLTVSSAALASALQSGEIVICNVGPGDFTTLGHFFVITGLDSDGLLIINDPYSTVRSAKHWDIDTVISQTRALFAFSI